MSLLGKIANKEIINFLRTMTIKSTYFAEKSKESIKLNAVNQVPDFELPYVRHVAGEYVLKNEFSTYVTNPSTGKKELQVYGTTTKMYDRNGQVTLTAQNRDIFTDSTFDEMMFVTSLDTGEEIPFTLENFYPDCAVAAGHSSRSIHSKTLTAYKLPGRFYELLCERYPNQVDLIKAIVYRVPDTNLYQGSAIFERRRKLIADAKNFDILSYDETLLGESERIDLVMHTKSILNIIKRRWDIKEYAFEENYPAVLWATMWSILPMALTARRLYNVKTVNVSDNLMWDYLISKGLESYKGFLTSSQAKYLYKNISYLKAHRGKQMVTNLLIDELLRDIGLSIKSKTVVLDTTDTLEKIDHKEERYNVQCDTCPKYNKSCFKHITDHLCDDRVDTKELCRNDVIVITEEFAGASKTKIIAALKNEYGLSDEEAERKYKRSFIWKDADIETIKSDLNRDQLVDRTGSTEELDVLIDKLHKNGLEPAINEQGLDIIKEDQKLQLQHTTGTYAPTKILEMVEESFNVKFNDLFNRFFTETVLRFAPHYKNGLYVRKALQTYKFVTVENTGEYFFDFGELVAASYYGFTREYLQDVIVAKDIQWDEEKKRWNWPLEYKTDFENVLTNNFAIPNHARVTSAFRFGCPVIQEELIDAWNQSSIYRHPELRDHVTNAKDGMRIVDIRNRSYAVAESNTNTEMWETYPVKLEILGEFAVSSYGGQIELEYVENDNEIPVIPTYVKWYFNHLTPVEQGTGTIWPDSDKVSFPESFVDPEYNPEIIDEPVDNTNRVDSSKESEFIRVRLDQYVNLDYVIENYCDVMGSISTQKEFGEYLTKMFRLLERIYCFASNSGNIRTHLSCKKLLECILVDENITFDLVQTKKTRTDSKEQFAYYSDWFESSKDITGNLASIDSVASSGVWNEFNAAATKCFLEGCTLPYVSNTMSKVQFRKLKELIVSLSSYRINMIETEEEGSVCNEIVTSISDSASVSFSKKSTQHFEIVGESECAPHLANYMDDNGNVFVQTHDLYRVEGKTYFVIKPNDGDAIEEFSGGGCDYIEFTEGEIGDELPPLTCFEKINLYEKLAIQEGTPLNIFMNSGKWFYQIGTPKQVIYPVIAYKGEDGVRVKSDTYLTHENITEKVKEETDLKVYFKEKLTTKYDWDLPVESSVLSYWLQPTIARSQLVRKMPEKITEYNETESKD